VLGVNPLGEAYKTFEVRPPYESEFDDVEGDVECPYGMIRVHFRRREAEGVIVLELTVLMSIAATVPLPEARGKVTVERKQGSGGSWVLVRAWWSLGMAITSCG